MIITSSLTNQELLEFAKEHIRYEIKMLNFTWNYLSKNNTSPLYLSNALIESFTLHTRILLEFLYPKEKIRKNDIVGYHYFNNQEEYYKYIPKRSIDIENMIQEISKMAAHLTTFRIENNKERKRWNLIIIKQNFVSSLQVFLSNALPEKIGDISDLQKLNWNEDYCLSISVITESGIKILS